MKHATKEHYKILQIDEKADLDAIKKAYRKRAFELHPDLNPSKSDAHKHFQLLNEAYVILIERASKEKQETKKASEKYQSNSQSSTSSSTHSSSNKNTSSSQNTRQTNQQTKAENTQQKAESHKRTYSKPSHEDDLRRKAQNAYSKEGNKAQSKVFTKEEQKKAENTQNKPKQEDVLRDLLNDPFARRVYEDIYKSVKNNKDENIDKKVSVKKSNSSNFNPLKKITDNISEQLGKVDFDSGVSGYMKSWMLKQIDDTLEFRFPITSLYPGSRIRLQISQGMNKEVNSVEITLPHDFIIGKPIKLEGMGKKIGKWQGDLYINLLPTLPKQ